MPKAWKCGWPKFVTWFLAMGAAIASFSAPMRAETTLTGISHRHGSLEFYANAMDKALPDVRVNMTMVPFDKAVELQTINLSQSSDAYDIIWVNDSQLRKYAKRGWLEPLDAYWEKYKQQFNLTDYPDSVLNSYRFDGKLYAVPAQVNGMFMFYRKDIFDAKGLKPPQTFEQWLEIAKALNGPSMAGVVVNLKRVDAALNEANYYINAYGDGWFDLKWKPIFNNAKGVAAIERLKEMSRYAQRGVTASANDEAMISFQQGLGATGLQWFSRAAAMDDAAKSKVVGKIDWAVPPNGNQMMVVDGYAISKFSKKDKDQIFRVLATGTNETNQRAIAHDAIPSRQSVMDDKELQARFRHYPAAFASLKVGKGYPQIPEFVEAGDAITLRLQQAISGEMTVKAALDLAAKEVEELLEKRGYYK